MSRPLFRFSALLVFACSGRMSFDTHTLPGTGGRASDETGGLGASDGGTSPEGGASTGGVRAGDGGAAPEGGASTGGVGADDCGGTHSSPRPPDADAGEPEEDESEELECQETSSCFPCATHVDCAYRWLCDPVLLVCVECLSDTNCPHGTCDTRVRRCH